MSTKTPSEKNINWHKSAKLVIGILAIVAAIIYLLISATLSNLQYFITIDELLANPSQYQGKNIRISGAVIGDSIQFDEDARSLTFTIAHISGDHKQIDQSGGMGKALKEAVENPNANRLNVVYSGIKPDLLKDQSQAIITGELIDPLTFKADELLLKCPTKYEGAAN